MDFKRGVAQWLSASALGAESRGFDPRRPDHFSILRPGDSLTALYNSRERKNRFLFLRIGDNRELPEVALGLKALCEPLGSDFQGDRQPSGKTVAGDREGARQPPGFAGGAEKTYIAPIERCTKLRESAVSEILRTF